MFKQNFDDIRHSDVKEVTYREQEKKRERARKKNNTVLVAYSTHREACFENKATAGT